MGTKRKTWYLRKKDILYVEENVTARGRKISWVRWVW